VQPPRERCRSEPADDSQIVRVARTETAPVHAKRKPDVWSGNPCPCESRRSHADDGERLAVDPHLPTDDIRVGTHLLPQ
jgi:hypothetical protein